MSWITATTKSMPAWMGPEPHSTWPAVLQVPPNYQGRVLNEAFDIVAKRSAVFA